MKFLKILLIPVLGMTLIGCAQNIDIIQSPDSELFLNETLVPAGSDQAVNGADWSKAEKIKITISEYGFYPMFVDVTAGKPYIFIFEKNDDISHSIVGDDFFDTLAVKSLSNNAQATPGTRIENIDLSQTSSRELRAIPMKKGRFEIADGGMGIFVGAWHFNIMNHFRGYPAGVVTVQ